LSTPACEQEEIKAATAELERLVAEGVFEAQDCGLLHGQMPPEQKDAVLQQFKEGRIKVLVRWGGGSGWWLRSAGRLHHWWQSIKPARAARRHPVQTAPLADRSNNPFSAVCAALLWLRWEWMWLMPL
jgi:hypothetical protein